MADKEETVKSIMALDVNKDDIVDAGEMINYLDAPKDWLVTAAIDTKHLALGIAHTDSLTEGFLRQTIDTDLIPNIADSKGKEFITVKLEYAEEGKGKSTDVLLAWSDVMLFDSDKNSKITRLELADAVMQAQEIVQNGFLLQPTVQLWEEVKGADKDKNYKVSMAELEEFCKSLTPVQKGDIQTQIEFLGVHKKDEFSKLDIDTAMRQPTKFPENILPVTLYHGSKEGEQEPGRLMLIPKDKLEFLDADKNGLINGEVIAGVKFVLNQDRSGAKQPNELPGDDKKREK